MPLVHLNLIHLNLLLLAQLGRRRSSGLSEKEWVDFTALDSSLYKEECPLSDAAKSLKAKAVDEAAASGNLPLLAEYARASEGLVSTQLRTKVWPLLLQLDVASHNGTLLQSPDPSHLNTHDLPPHRDEGQVMLDIRRLFTDVSHFYTANINSDHYNTDHSLYTAIFTQAEIEGMRRRLYGLVVRVLRKYPFLNYYQGYHDVASVVLMVFGENGDDDLAFLVLERLTVCHLRDFMVSDIALSINHLRLIACVVEEADPTMFRLIRHASNSLHDTNGVYYDYKFFQALLSVLTMYSHDVLQAQLLVVWDFIFSYRSVALSLYIYAAAMIHFKPTILARLGVDDLCTFLSVDSDLVHTLLLPNNLFGGLSDTDLAHILAGAKLLIEAYPLETLRAAPETWDVWFGEYNHHSVLCTTLQLCRDVGREEEGLLHGKSSAVSKHLDGLVVGEEDHGGNNVSVDLSIGGPAIPGDTPVDSVTISANGPPCLAAWPGSTTPDVATSATNAAEVVSAFGKTGLNTEVHSGHDNRSPSSGQSFCPLPPMSVSEVERLVMAQEEEQRKESVHEAEIFQRLLCDESLATSVASLDGESSRMALLSSSLSSVTAASISLNHKLMHNLSVFFRKIFSRDDEHEGNVAKRTILFSLQGRVAKVSLTIGFVGFVVHFLLRHSGGPHVLQRLLNVDYGVRSLIDAGMANLGRQMMAGVSHVAADVASYVRDSEMVHGLDLTHVGLGTLRNSVYGLSN